MKFDFQIAGVSSIVLIIFGIVSCFWGYRFFKLLMAVWGFVLCFLLTTLIFQNYLKATQVVTLIAGAVGGVIGSTLFAALINVGIFALGGLLGHLLIMFLVSTGRIPLHPGIEIIAVVLGGILALVLKRPMIIISMSASGAWLLIAGASQLLGFSFNPMTWLQHPQFWDPQHTQYSLIAILWVLLSVIGMISQFKFTPKSAAD
ncbi:TMEM198/TM7SF3 family protein [candidate division KSB1 bacterium]|nr:TMEM198/TM7SF3 family protein [candidate division KSB1 bacterium]